MIGIFNLIDSTQFEKLTFNVLKSLTRLPARHYYARWQQNHSKVFQTHSIQTRRMHSRVCTLHSHSLLPCNSVVTRLPSVSALLLNILLLLFINRISLRSSEFSSSKYTGCLLINTIKYSCSLSLSALITTGSVLLSSLSIHRLVVPHRKRLSIFGRVLGVHI